MIRFPNGYEFTFACASGALAFDGRGWWWEYPFRWARLLDPKALTVVAKTVTLEPVIGNYKWHKPWTCVRVVRRNGKFGMTNAIGLTNDGLPKWIERDYYMAKKMGYNIAASVKPNNPAEAAIMAQLLHQLDLAYIEVNVSCPNVDHIPDDIPNILWALQGARKPLVLKLSKSQVTKKMIQAVDGIVDGYHGINTMPWDDVFPGETSPIEKYPHHQKGGVSGDFIFEDALACMRRLNEWTGKPKIGGGGIGSVNDVLAFETAGATGFSLGSRVFPLTPWAPNRIIKEYNQIKRRAA